MPDLPPDVRDRAAQAAALAFRTKFDTTASTTHTVRWGAVVDAVAEVLAVEPDHSNQHDALAVLRDLVAAIDVHVVAATSGPGWTEPLTRARALVAEHTTSEERET